MWPMYIWDIIVYHTSGETVTKLPFISFYNFSNIRNTAKIVSSFQYFCKVNVSS